MTEAVQKSNGKLVKKAKKAALGPAAGIRKSRGKSIVVQETPEPSTTSDHMRHVHKLMSKVEYDLAGGEGLMGTYGTMKPESTDRVLASLRRHTRLGPDSMIADAGAGTGRVLVSAMAVGLKPGIGYEFDPIKCAKGRVMMDRVLTQLETSGKGSFSGQRPDMIEADLMNLKCLDRRVTHVVAFWEGISTEARQAVADLVRRSSRVKGLMIGQRAIRGQSPEEELEELGFPPLKLMDTFQVSMCGEGKSFTAYIFLRK